MPAHEGPYAIHRETGLRGPVGQAGAAAQALATGLGQPIPVNGFRPRFNRIALGRAVETDQTDRRLG
jgi:hypothetical protein